MSERVKIQLLVALLVIAGAVYFYERNAAPSLPGVLSADTRFVPLSVTEPALQVGRLQQLQKDEYKGSHRNIFVAGPPPPPPGAETHTEATRPMIGPQPVPPPPPLQVPVEFYGVESSAGGKKVALLKNGDDIIIVAEGDTFMKRFRLIRIGNQSADVEEISTNRQATLPMVQPQDQSGAASN